MTSSLRLSIAGRTFSLQSDPDTLPLSLAEAYQPFLRDPSDSPAADKGTYNVIKADTTRLDIITGKPFWSNEIWRMGPNDKTGVTLEIYNVIAQCWVPVAQLTNDFACGTIQPFHGRRAAPGPFALNYPYDQAILIHRLLHTGAAIIHGAGIVVNGCGYVFFGPSGIGKTTTSRLWTRRGATLLNDDRVALFQDADGCWQVGGTPWHGEEPQVRDESAPLKGIIRLRQGPREHLRTLEPAEGLTELLACALIPFFSRPGIEKSMDLLSGLYGAVPFREFTLRPVDEALDYFLAAES